MRFSQRIGKTSVRDAIQLESIDEILTNRLWNILDDYFNVLSGYADGYGDTEKGLFFLYVWTEFFNERADLVRSYDGNYLYDFRNKKFSYNSVYNYVSDCFFDCEWYEKFDFIEFVAGTAIRKSDFNFSSKINQVLEREVSAYRIVDNKIVEITSELEIVEIEEAASASENSVRTHLEAGLKYLSDRKNPDYRNSIKESISAVESFCQKITGDDKATLGKALAIIEKKHYLHAALKSSFNALYGYTSDASGIRHALTDEAKELTFEEAKFMLVSCSSFINYLRSLTKDIM